MNPGGPRAALRIVVAVALFAQVASTLPVLAAAPHDPPLVDADTSAMAEPVRRGIAAYRQLVDDLATGGGGEARREELAQAYGQLGQLYHAHALTEAALAAYANARRVDPSAHRWAYYLGILEQTSGATEAARRDLEAALALAPDDLPTRLRLGQIAVAERRLDAAEDLFRAVIERDADSAAAWFGLGQVAAERRDAAAAIEAFERVLTIQPEATLAHYPLGLAYRDRGDAERAREHVALRGEGAVRSEDPLVRELTTLAKLSALQVVLSQAADRAVPPRELVGFAFGQLGALEGAVDYLRAALASGAATATAPARIDDPYTRARVLDVVGALLVEQGRLDDAAVSFEEALALAPELGDASVRLGNLRGRQGRFEEALTRYDAVLAREPRNAEALLGRADAMARLGRDEDALASLERLEAVTPGQGRVVLRRAAALERLGRADSAIASYRAAVTLAANDAQSAAAHAGVGRVLAAHHEDAAALEELASAVRLEPTNTRHLLDLAALEAKVGRYVEAAGHYGEVVVLDGGNEAARIGEASALLLAARWVEARARLEGGVRRLPESTTLRHLLARFLAGCPQRDLRDGQRAVELAEALAHGGSPPSLRETLAMALAQSGQFDRAIETQAALVNEAPASAAVARSRLDADLERYRRREPCCASDDPALLLP